MTAPVITRMRLVLAATAERKMLGLADRPP
jgi:hypothetical protein